MLGLFGPQPSASVDWVNVSVFAQVEASVQNLLDFLRTRPFGSTQLNSARKRIKALGYLIWEHSNEEQGQVSRELTASPDTEVVRLHVLARLALPHLCVHVCRKLMEAIDTCVDAAAALCYFRPQMNDRAIRNSLYEQAVLLSPNRPAAAMLILRSHTMPCT